MDERVLTHFGVDYVLAAIIGAGVTIIGNFVLQELFVFRDVRQDSSKLWIRFAASVSFNSVEAALRIPVMALMVETWRISSVIATAISLVVAFFARFLFHALVADTAALRIIRAIDEEAMRPGEL